MKAFWEKAVSLFLFFAILGGKAIIVNSVPYDYSASDKCLPEPLKPQYKGGMIVNPEFDKALDGWVSNGKTAHKVSKSGNKYSVAKGISQKLDLNKDKLYTFSAWVQVDKGSADVRAVVKTADGKFVTAAAGQAKESCWSMLKGGVTVNASGPGELFFDGVKTTAEIWVDSVSLQPFTLDEWKGHQNEIVKKLRKKTVKVQAVDAQGKPLAKAKFSANPIRPQFPFGNAINQAIIKNPGYQKWFASRFTWTTFENEMKWYGTEFTEGHVDYSTADAMLAFAKENNVSVRGHNVFWDDQNTQMAWVMKLSKEQLREAAAKRLKSVVTKYKGQVHHWDVNNENVHFNFYETKLGVDATIKFYNDVNQIDPDVVLFLNDFNIMEDPSDFNVTPDKYLKKFKEIRPGNKAKMAIGLEAHFGFPNLPYVRSVLDMMATAGVPLWFTELDVDGSGPKQAVYLDQLLKEAYSYPAIEGIVMWASWTPKGCYRMCLTDNNFKNNAAGDTVDAFIKEVWKTRAEGTTGADGSFEAELANGEYEVEISHPTLKSSKQTLKVDAQTKPVYKLQFKSA